MSRPVLYLHVGLMKTGTTYLQGVMDGNRETLTAAGINFVGETWSRQVRAAQDLLHLDQHDPQIASLSAGAWDALLDDVRSRPDATNVVSMEFLSFARRRSSARLARDLAGIDTHVVLTVRDAAATIPAQWQTSITSGSTHSWADFQAGVQNAVRPWWPAYAVRGDSAVREFRRTQDVGRVLDVWRRAVPADHLHVITVPLDRRDPELLWRRFSEVIGVDPGAATEAPTDSNPSLGHPSSELVRRLNLVLADVKPWDYNRTIKTPLASSILAARRREERRPGLDEATATVAREWNRRTRDVIQGSGAHLVGDLDDLPVTSSASAAASAEPTPREVLDAGATAWHGLVDLVERRRRRVARIMGANRPEALAPREPGWLERGGSAVDLDGAIRDLSRLARTSIQLRREILELRESDDSDSAGDA
ncbi:hypothetical protein [Nocardioides mangrovi]|uniref:Sulfotransferase family protein n=1 Tax=Nocardioides mangrovi TaxID=2874580 RepID=A0ABS7UE91_9ACTN|nr:hypothetical protein [Nocardioides mangrovi]MBZ5739323.1 hypothetical protein [Nocardioides mangrovi]